MVRKLKMSSVICDERALSPGSRESAVALVCRQESKRSRCPVLAGFADCCTEGGGKDKGMRNNRPFARQLLLEWRRQTQCSPRTLRRPCYAPLSNLRGSTGAGKAQTYVDNLIAREALWVEFKQDGNVLESKQNYAALLQTCIEKDAWTEGRQVHQHIVRCGWESDLYLGGNLVRLYASSGRMGEARDVFRKMHKQNTYSWASLIRGYVDVGNFREALKLFDGMMKQGVKPHAVLFVYVLRACAGSGDVVEGRRVHSHVVEHGLGSNLFVGSALVDMYAKCGSMSEARESFESMSERDVVAWTAVISGYASRDLGLEAIKLYEQMQEEKVRPNHVTFVCILKACGSVPSLATGRRVHTDVNKLGLDSDLTVQNSLVDMYAKCGSMEDARHIFEGMPTRDVVSWNAMINGCWKNKLGWEGIRLYQLMQQEKFDPDKTTFACVLKACGSVSALDEGRQVHSHVKVAGLQSDVMVGTALMDMYAECGSMEDAQKVFDEMPHKDRVSWNAMISGSVQHGRAKEALLLYEQMKQDGIDVEEDTFASVLKACADIRALEAGKEIHNNVRLLGLDCYPLIGNSLLYMYSRCGSLYEARQVFDNMVQRDVLSWYSMISGYAEHGRAKEAIQLYEELEDERIKPNARMLASVLNACAETGSLQVGRRVHADIIQNKLPSDLSLGNALIDMYAKCRHVEGAKRVFDEMPNRDVVSWTAMIAGYTLQGRGEEAIKLFEQMLQENVRPNAATFSSTLKACAIMASLHKGRQVHSQLLKSGLELTVVLRTAVLDMYAKCGRLGDARHEFENMPRRSVISWNAMIAAYAQQGFPEEAFRLFDQMQQEGLQPNSSTISCMRKVTVTEANHGSP